VKKLFVATVTAAALGLVFGATAIAQTQAVTKTVTGEKKTVTATVEQIERSTRSVTLKSPEGVYTEVTVPAGVARFDTLKVGDKVSATYYENVVLRLKAPGEKAHDTDEAAVTPGSGAKAGGTVATQRTITATITAIDMNVPSITFSGPRGWTYSSRVDDKKTLAKVKVGDRLDITWTEAVLISVEAPR
jgi:hypothetical protein